MDKIIGKIIFLILVCSIGGCAVSPPSLFDVETFCESPVKKYKGRTKELLIDIECKD